MADAERIQRWRDDTPGTAHRNHLDNAGAALAPVSVVEAMHEHIDLEARIGGYAAADAREEKIECVRDDVARLVAAGRRNVAIAASATDAFVRAVSSFDFAPGDVIVTSRCDYTSNQIQYLALRCRLGIEVVHADDLPEGGVDPDAVRGALARAGRRCRLVAISWVPTNSGLVQDVGSVGAVCEDAGVPFLVDACQAAGQIPIDVGRLRCDYLSVTARKFLRGPRGVGFLYASDRALKRGDHPLFVDMRGAEWVAPDAYRIADTARRYEDWEFAYALVLGLGAAVRYALDVGIPAARDRAWTLAARARDGLAAIPGVRVLDRGATRCAIVTFDHEHRPAREIVAALAARRINAVASLGWYGQFDFREKQVEAAVRVSPHYYNTEAEVDAMLAAVGEIVAGA